jgi:hypothetical protein
VEATKPKKKRVLINQFIHRAFVLRTCTGAYVVETLVRIKFAESGARTRDTRLRLSRFCLERNAWTCASVIVGCYFACSECNGLEADAGALLRQLHGLIRESPNHPVDGNECGDDARACFAHCRGFNIVMAWLNEEYHLQVLNPNLRHIIVAPNLSACCFCLHQQR